MKTITVKDYTLHYKVEYDVNEFGDCEWTDFFLGTETVTRRKFWLFGKKIEKQVPKFVFSVNFDIETPTRTKQEIREILERRVELLNRAEEIEKGEII